MSRLTRSAIATTVFTVAAASLATTQVQAAAPAVSAPAAVVTAPNAATDIYFTFDDGPHPTWTPKILAVLRKYNAKATFFMLGQNAATRPWLVTSVRAGGHHTSNHTWSHPNLTLLSNSGINSQIARTDAVLSWRKCVRPPYGATNTRVKSVINARGQKQVLWNVDTRDWERPGVTTIANRITANARVGRIILMHDGGGDRSQTVAALDRALANLKARGYTFSYIPYC